VTGIFHIVLARKPLEGTIAENCLQWGCGALWIDGTRVKFASNDDESESKNKQTKKPIGGFSGQRGNVFGAGKGVEADIGQAGRFPANLILGGEEVARGFPETRSGKPSGVRHGTRNRFRMVEMQNSPIDFLLTGYGDSGSASRFFFNFTEQESDE